MNDTTSFDMEGLVQREVERQEERRDRRRGDRIFDNIIKPLVPWFIAGLVTSGIGAWVNLALLSTEIRELRENFSAHKIENKAEIDSLKESKDFSKGLQTILNISLEEIRRRMDEQDKRMQMQGEGLITGNRSIHEALEKLMILSSNEAVIGKRLDILENQFGLFKSIEEKTRGRK